jgi:TNF receptor-associated factor 6
VDEEWLGPPRQSHRLHSIAPRSLPDSGVGSNVDTLAEKAKVQDSKLSHMSQRMLVLEAKVQHLEKKVKEQSTTIRQQHELITDLDTRCSHGFFQWKITEFARRSREAQNGTTTVIHSPGFYSSFRGHKMCLRVNLNGVESGYGTHLSLFVHLMRGEFDDEVTWPFAGKIRLTVIDQGPEKQHVVEVLEGTERIAAFQRPPAGTTRNHKGFGYMEFMPLSRLLSGPMESKGAAYVLNDSLLIRCEVYELNSKLP